MATIILGITGSIAAYKAADIASSLTKRGHEVHCICTEKALEFVTAATLQTVSRHAVISSFDDEKNVWPPPHIELAQKADVFVVAPATANTMAQMAAGLAPNVLMSIYLACPAKVLVCPAMNESMWAHCATQRNAEVLAARENHEIFGPDDEGMLACGVSGKGRLMPAERIVEKILEVVGDEVD